MVSQINSNYLSALNQQGGITPPAISPQAQIIPGLNFKGGENIDTVTIGQSTANNVDAGPLTNCLLEKDKNNVETENGNLYKKTNKSKIAGAILGALVPLATTVVKAIKSGSLRSVLNLKNLAITVPALGLAGLAAGSLVDCFVNAKRAENADKDKV